MIYPLARHFLYAIFKFLSLHRPVVLSSTVETCIKPGDLCLRQIVFGVKVSARVTSESGKTITFSLLQTQCYFFSADHIHISLSKTFARPWVPVQYPWARFTRRLPVSSIPRAVDTSCVCVQLFYTGTVTKIISS